jgi:hypothetical protein
MINNCIYIFYRYIKFKNLYFYINSTLLWMYNTVSHHRDHVKSCFKWKFLDSGNAKMSVISDTYEQTLILVRVQNIGHAYKGR